ncbi:MAG: 30S ribosome-binding factor RbfA [Candidatus Omnitrophica bacterium]|nr:30S ribosome-binding factor RbfA [Candidatus Omnitrophota bacterium]MDD5352805.1 30S ribosome-binding factor RbfA [Candidatus Omnitrophota bacterium]MDD5550404.1 30S ribosome-binding factor RbfA [Candidatus Omnitrophota bacterium]
MSRKERVQEAIKQEVSSIIHDELKDPCIGFATVTRAEISQDLRHAKIYVSVLGKQKQDKSTFLALERAKGYIRRLLAQRLKLRFTPEIMFKEDNSAEYSVYIAKKIDELNNENK